MTFEKSVKTCLFEKYATFSGRASRSEFWWFFLFFWMATVVAIMVLGVFAATLVSIAAFLPNLAVSARRLHDRDMSGWWLLIALIPFVNLALFVLFCIAGSDGDNRFGSDPNE